MKLEVIYQLYCKHFLVDTDTRNIRKNTLFFALKGANFNGNMFAEKALELGASFAIVDEKEYQTQPNIILVDNVLNTLQELAKLHRNSLKILIIGLTGSNGKTTTKELINAVLSEKYTTTATIGNLNNHIGVPLTLLSMTPKTEIGIVEMGANHQKEIEFLCSICQPDYGYITNFGKAHLEGFGSFEGVIKGKSELYSFLKTRKKTVFVNPNDEIQIEKTTEINHVTFHSDIHFKGVNPCVHLSFKEVEIQSNLIGKYNFSNIAATITMGAYFKISTQKIKNAIEKYVPENNRSQIIKRGNKTIILDAYNANPTSMRAALKNLDSLKGQKKSVILGDMFELGNDAENEHQEIADLSTNLNFSNVFLVGKHFNTSTTKAQQFLTFEELKNVLQNLNFEGHFILIKGSRGMQLERILTFFN